MDELNNFVGDQGYDLGTSLGLDDNTSNVIGDALAGITQNLVGSAIGGQSPQGNGVDALYRSTVLQSYNGMVSVNNYSGLPSLINSISNTGRNPALYLPSGYTSHIPTSSVFTKVTSAVTTASNGTLIFVGGIAAVLLIIVLKEKKII